MDFQEIKNEKIIGETFFGKYKVIEQIGKGSFGSVFKGINRKDKISVAIKISKKNEKFRILETECNFLIALKSYGIPKVISFGHRGEYAVLIEELLGKSIKEIFLENKLHIELKEVCLIGIQIIDRLEFIHSKNVIHLDIKPENFLLGKNDPSTIYIIDFGLSKKYRSSRTGKHIKFSINRYVTGNRLFLSINALRGVEQSRRDDLESVGYMLVFLLKGKLPWCMYKWECQEMSKFKQKYTPEKLCEDLPKEMAEFLKYTRTLNFEEKPDYEYLRNLLRYILVSNYGTSLLTFYWEEKTTNKRSRGNSGGNIHRRSSSSRNRLLKEIRKSLNQKSLNKTNNNNLNKTGEAKEEIENIRLNNSKEIMKRSKQIYNRKQLIQKLNLTTKNTSPNIRKSNVTCSRVERLYLTNIDKNIENNIKIKYKNVSPSPKYIHIKKQIYQKKIQKIKDKNISFNTPSNAENLILKNSMNYFQNIDNLDVSDKKEHIFQRSFYGKNKNNTKNNDLINISKNNSFSTPKVKNKINESRITNNEIYINNTGNSPILLSAKFFNPYNSGDNIQLSHNINKSNNINRIKNKIRNIKKFFPTKIYKSNDIFNNNNLNFLRDETLKEVNKYYKSNDVSYNLSTNKLNINDNVGNYYYGSSKNSKLSKRNLNNFIVNNNFRVNENHCKIINIGLKDCMNNIFNLQRRNKQYKDNKLDADVTKRRSNLFKKKIYSNQDIFCQELNEKE